MKGSARFIAVVAIAAFAGSCTGISVGADHDPSADFSKFRTFAWMAVPSAETGHDLEAPMDKRIKDGVAHELEAKGIRKTSDGPDLLVAYHTGRERRLEVDDWGYGDWSGTGGGNVFAPNEGSLVIDLIDARTNKLVWRGTAADTVSRNPKTEEVAEKIARAIEKMFSQYPPK